MLTVLGVVLRRNRRIFPSGDRSYRQHYSLPLLAEGWPSPR